jgi:SHS2 domain-containing protein
VSYEFIEHTADIRLRAVATDQKALFLELVSGMNEFLFGEGDYSAQSGKMIVDEVIELHAPDEVALLVDWLSQILLLTAINHGRVIPLEITHISKTALCATVRVYAATQVEDIKAVTYHGLSIGETPQGLEACVTFDI